MITYRFLNTFPTPAVNPTAALAGRGVSSKASPTKDNGNTFAACHSKHSAAGTLPLSASSLPNAARSLLVCLLERDPRVRMRNLRQLQQSAFYMGYNFDHVKNLKMSPKMILEYHFSGGIPAALAFDSSDSGLQVFPAFDQPPILI